jgi:simple sugar transport system substrate-binding protein
MPMKNFIRGGLKEGYVKMSPYGKAVSEAGRKKADTTLAEMKKGTYAVFKGPLKDNTGKLVIPAGTAYKQTEPVLEQMSYLVEGVVGSV